MPGRFRLPVNGLLIATHVACWTPLAWVVVSYLRDPLKVNPIQDFTFGTGLPALILLSLSLAVTPANTLLGWRWAIPLRRWLGLYAFFYVCLHLLIFVGLDYGFDPALIYEAIFEKRYALVGFAAFLLLLPLALTSTRGWQKRLGRNWKRLHRLSYVAVLLAVVHFVWLVKADLREPLAYGAVVVGLLTLRLPPVRRRLSGLRARLAARFGRRPATPTKPIPRISPPSARLDG